LLRPWFCCSLLLLFDLVILLFLFLIGIPPPPPFFVGVECGGVVQIQVFQIQVLYAKLGRREFLSSIFVSWWVLLIIHVFGKWWLIMCWFFCARIIWTLYI
jgi:hypothetical protein